MAETFPIPREEQLRLLIKHRDLIEAIAPGIRVFGAFARGEVHTGSDIDLLIPLGSSVEVTTLDELEIVMFNSPDTDAKELFWVQPNYRPVDLVAERDLFWLLSRRIRAEARTVDEIIAGNYAPAYERDFRMQAALIAWHLHKIHLPIPESDDRGPIDWCEAALFCLQRVNYRVQKIPVSSRSMLPDSVWAGLLELREIEGLYSISDLRWIDTETTKEREDERVPANPTKYFTTDISRSKLERYANLASELVDRIRQALPDIGKIEADIAGEGNPFPVPEIPEDWKWWRT